MLAVNARFLGQRITGIERFAREITLRLPRKRVRSISPARALHGVQGQVWEQLVLPRHLKEDEILWSPANSGPVSVRRQIVTVHDLSVFDHPEWFARRVRVAFELMMPRLMSNAAHVTTDSEFSRGRLIAHFEIDPQRISIVPCGVETREQGAIGSSGGRVRWNDPSGREDSRPYILACGGPDPRKNIGRLIQAWRLVSAEFPEIQLRVFGATRSKTFFTPIEYDPRSDEGVSWVGYITDAELLHLYSGAALFVYPSLYEGFGLPPLEAMAAGVPVVLSDIPVFREMFVDAAERVNPYDVADIARGIRRVLCDSALADRIVLRGIDLAAHYSWERSAGALMEIVEKVVVGNLPHS